MISGLQISAIVLCSMGIAVEITYEADLGFLLVTIGSLAFGVSTKIEALRDKINHRRKH